MAIRDLAQQEEQLQSILSDFPARVAAERSAMLNRYDEMKAKERGDMMLQYAHAPT